MKYKVYKGSAVGYKNYIKNKNSQDNISFKQIKNGVIAVVADGHSTDYFEYSDKGSEYACKSTIEVLEEYASKVNEIYKYLDTKEIQKKIYSRWREYVRIDYTKKFPIVRNIEYLKYSTTIVACLIADKIAVYIKLGDGGIVKKSENKYEEILEEYQIDIVKSIGLENSYNDIKYLVEEIDMKSSDAVVLFTDGYSDSFENKDIMYEDIENTLYHYNKNVFSKALFYKTYPNYLKLLSEKKSKDDISIIYVVVK